MWVNIFKWSSRHRGESATKTVKFFGKRTLHGSLAQQCWHAITMPLSQHTGPVPESGVSWDFRAQSPPNICHAPTARHLTYGDGKLPDTLTTKTGRKWKCWISKFALNNITPMFGHIKDYRQLPAKWHDYFPQNNCCDLVTLLPLHLPPFADCRKIEFNSFDQHLRNYIQQHQPITAFWLVLFCTF